MYPLLISSNPLVAYDVDRFRRLIASKGGVLGDGVLSEREAVARLTACVTAVYASVGRRDFWPFAEAYQVGVGSKVYSLHGLEGTLVGGPTWGRHGVSVDSRSSAAYILVPSEARLGIKRATHFIVANPDEVPVGANTGLIYHGGSLAMTLGIAVYFWDAEDYRLGIGFKEEASNESVKNTGALNYHKLATFGEFQTISSRIDCDAPEADAVLTAINEDTYTTSSIFVGSDSLGLFNTETWLGYGWGEFAGTISFYAGWLDAAISNEQHTQVRRAFKSTIGKDLGIS